MKIIITGYSGSGKSTLAKALGDCYNIPVLHLDNVQYYDDWKMRTLEEKTEIVKKFLENNNDWVIDGNYYNLCPERFLNVDKYFNFNYNRFYCFKKCRERYLKNIGKIRESCHCIEKFDWEFKKWILFESRIKKRRKKHLKIYNECQSEKYRFNNVKEYNKWLIDNNIDITKYFED